ncbi:MAG: glycerol-3-phosphate 1-O-acyltransferase PlsY [Clostridiaceae bacterium]|nr:glycerol-3-phosphate 1-O-acyltransferase PlsY [Clostridiaceae bacterium]
MVCAYLLGSFSTSITVSKLFYHQDIRQMGSGNAGATNTLRNFGAHKALLVMLGDGLKAVLAMWMARWLVGPEAMLYAGGVAVLGHIFPVYYGFQGGKGVMSAAAMILAFDWRMFLIMLAVFASTVLLTRIVSLASILAAVSFLPSMLLFHRDNLWYVLFSGGLAAVVIWKHRSNIRRLKQGTESKLGDSNKNKR